MSRSHRRPYPLVTFLVNLVRRPRVRSGKGNVLRRSRAVSCPHCGMLLGSVAQRRGICPRCRQPFTLVEGEAVAVERGA